MGKLVEVILRSGILDDQILIEFNRWSGSPDLLEKPSESMNFPEEVVNGIEEALHEQGMVLMRETDLEAISQYLGTVQEAVLHVTVDDSVGILPVQVGRDKKGDYLLPWQAESIVDALTNGETFLLIDDKKIFFKEARELFYGNTKAFVVCVPSVQKEASDE